MDGGRSDFPPIAEYAFLSDCETGALIAADGSVEWLCLPRFDSPSLFGAILDRGAGSFRLGPDEQVPLDRRYLPGTNVVETTWATETGWLVVRDALVLGAGRPGSARMMLRVAECIQGKVEVELVCDPRPDYATKSAVWALEESGRRARMTEIEPEIVLSGDIELQAEQGRIRGGRVLGAGESCFVALAWDGEIDPPRDCEHAAAMIEATGRFWRQWLSGGSFPDHPWRVHLQRSALVLKGLIYAPTGATVAAPTTSLPETPGGERNWDYRYTWIRDATFTLWGLHVLGFAEEADDFARFVETICAAEDSELQIMYGIGGERELPERTLDHLSGYEGARPVRVGNAAYAQRQNDVYGALLDSLYIHAKAGAGLPESLWPIVVAQVEAAAAVWQRPDQGIWEARGEPRHYVSSKLMCWVALDRGSRLAQARGESALASRWIAEAATIKAEILERGVSERGVMRQHYETDALDASNLLAPLVRFLPADDPRIRATVLATAEELTEGGMVLRYRVEETDDGLRGVEGTFTICSFWLVAALSEIGEPARARDLCELLLRFAGSVGLYSEEIEPRSGIQLGNFPQAFTHLSLINAVSHVIADEFRERDGRTAVFSEMRE